MGNKIDKSNIITVLGQTYEVIESKEECDKYNSDGLADYYQKKIFTRPRKDMFDGDTKLSDNVKDIRYKEVLRHELVHTFFDEAGLDNYSKDEVLVDWIGRQLPKMFNVCKELNII